MTEKKIPTVEQLNDFRHQVRTAVSAADCDKLNAFMEEYDIYTKVYEENGKVGVKDAAGQVLVPAGYEEVGYTFMDHSKPLAVPVLKDGKFALVAQDGKGTMLSDFEFDEIHYTPECCYILVKDGRKGLAMSDGTVVIPAQMDQVYTPFNGLASYEKDGKSGFSMIHEGITTEAVYDDCEIECDAYLEVVKDGVKGFIDSNGEFTTDENEAHFGSFCDY